MQPFAARQDWAFPPDASHSTDPLLSCLVHITALLGKPLSAEALVAALPIPEQGLTPQLLQRAAVRAGLSVRIARCSLDAIPKEAVPAVILLNDRQACVLLAKPTPETLRVMQPESGAASDITIEELAQRYSGHTIFVR